MYLERSVLAAARPEHQAREQRVRRVVLAVGGKVQHARLASVRLQRRFGRLLAHERRRSEQLRHRAGLLVDVRQWGRPPVSWTLGHRQHGVSGTSLALLLNERQGARAGEGEEGDLVPEILVAITQGGEREVVQHPVWDDAHPAAAELARIGCTSASYSSFRLSTAPRSREKLRFSSRERKRALPMGSSRAVKLSRPTTKTSVASWVTKYDTRRVSGSSSACTSGQGQRIDAHQRRVLRVRPPSGR